MVGGRKENNGAAFLIEWGGKIAAVMCWPFQKRVVITGSYGRKTPGDTYNKSSTQKRGGNNTKVILWMEREEKGQTPQRT